VIDDALIDEAATRLDISGRLEGRNGALFMDVGAPKDEADGAVLFLAQAMVGLHRETEDDDALVDIEEALEDPLRAGDQHGIDEGCDLYRAQLASRLKALARLVDGTARLQALRMVGVRP
jgi:hypothetical protein